MASFAAQPLRRFSTMPSRRRVVVTGMGLVTCLGTGLEHVWKRLINGDIGIGPLTGPEYEKLPCRVAGLVPRGQKPGELDLDRYVSPAQQRGMSLASCYALVAAQEAMQHARWKPESEQQKYRTGVAIGMGMSTLEEIVDEGMSLRLKGYKKVTPHFIPKILNNMASGHVSIKFHLKGINHSVSTACTTGVHSIGDASRFIQHGDVDVMVCGGTEACVSPLAVAGFARMRALSTKFNENPQAASRPFDKDRDGFVMAEGAGILVLEDLEHAIKRGAAIYAEILGYGLSGDASHITAPSQDGDGAYRCMAAALQDANVSAGDVGYVNAHSTSTPLGDTAEVRALARLFKDNLNTMKVSSSKGAIGHLLGGAGTVEAIFTIMACRTGVVPPTANLHNSDIDIPIDFVPLKSSVWPTITDTRTALTNSFGFGGTNASLCVCSFNK